MGNDPVESLERSRAPEQSDPMPVPPDEMSVEDLVAPLSKIRDVVQRSHALAGRLKLLGDAAVLEAIRIIRERAVEGNDVYRSLYNGLLCSNVLIEVLGGPRTSELVEKARDAGEFAIVALLMDIPSEMADETPFQPFLDPNLREVPLGARKELARKPDFKLIERIAKDQDHRVIGNLLNNSRLKEIDVVRIASTRPVSALVLEEIFGHPRWISRYPVKKAIILNPYAPLTMALRLLPYMRLQELEEVCGDPNLNSTLVEAARNALAEKRRQLSPGEGTSPPDDPG
jgi:hypothetical protein